LENNPDVANDAKVNGEEPPQTYIYGSNIILEGDLSGADSGSSSDGAWGDLMSISSEDDA